MDLAVLVAIAVLVVATIWSLGYAAFLLVGGVGPLARRPPRVGPGDEGAAAVAEAARILAEARCWNIKHCPAAQRDACPTYRCPGLPCWTARMQATASRRIKPECLVCTLFNLPALLN